MGNIYTTLFKSSDFLLKIQTQNKVLVLIEMTHKNLANYLKLNKQNDYFKTVKFEKLIRKSIKLNTRRLKNLLDVNFYQLNCKHVSIFIQIIQVT